MFASNQIQQYTDVNGSMTTPETTPVQERCTATETIVGSVNKTCDFLDDDEYPTADACAKVSQSFRGGIEDKDIATVNFADEIKVDFIESIDYRIMCRFLGATTVNDVKNHPFTAPPLITFILMENIVAFMEQNDFDFSGELNFDRYGKTIPPVKNAWVLRGKEKSFTITAFLYFAHKSGDKKKNVVFYLFADLERGGASITCFSADSLISREIINELKIYSKKNNCLRGSKLKDVNIISASFSEVELEEKYTWDNYYYTDQVKDLIELEVLGFIGDVEKYNKCNITKRGIIVYGEPGCVLADTKIKIRKKRKEGKHRIINK